MSEANSLKGYIVTTVLFVTPLTVQPFNVAKPSFNEPDRERILIKLSFAGLNRRDDDQDGVQHPERYQDWNPYQEDAKDRGDRVVNQHRDLEIQRFLSIRVNLRRVAAFYQPNGKWAENVTQKVKEQSK